MGDAVLTDWQGGFIWGWFSCAAVIALIVMAHRG